MWADRECCYLAMQLALPKSASTALSTVTWAAVQMLSIVGIGCRGSSEWDAFEAKTTQFGALASLAGIPQVALSALLHCPKAHVLHQLLPNTTKAPMNFQHRPYTVSAMSNTLLKCMHARTGPSR